MKCADLSSMPRYLHRHLTAVHQRVRSVHRPLLRPQIHMPLLHHTALRLPSPRPRHLPLQHLVSRYLLLPRVLVSVPTLLQPHTLHQRHMVPRRRTVRRRMASSLLQAVYHTIGLWISEMSLSKWARRRHLQLETLDISKEALTTANDSLMMRSPRHLLDVSRWMIRRSKRRFWRNTCGLASLMDRVRL